MGKRRDKLRADLAQFFKEYGRTSRRGGLDPNDRHYDRKTEREIKRMDPVELDAILRGADDEEVESRDSRFPCPCCSFLTLDEAPPGTFFICPVCRWEDDNVQFYKPAFRGGANDVSLNEARAYFAQIGVSDPKRAGRVRPPLPEERPSDD